MWGSFEVIWIAVLVFDLTLSMRRELRIRVVHEPNRLGAELLRQAYELVLPVTSRPLRRSVEEKEVIPGRQQQHKTPGSRA